MNRSTAIRRTEYSKVWLCALKDSSSQKFTIRSDIGQRRQHLNHIFRLLKNQTVLTAKSLRLDFQDQESLRLHVAGSLQLYSTISKSTHSPSGDLQKGDGPAILLLTSGSAGNPKAVCLPHGQIPRPERKDRLSSDKRRRPLHKLPRIG